MYQNNNYGDGRGGAKLASFLMWMAQNGGGSSSSSSSGMPSANQLSAFNAGAGPVSSQKANQLMGTDYVGSALGGSAPMTYNPDPPKAAASY